MLEHYREDRRFAAEVGVLLALTSAVIGTVVWGGFAWMTVWYMWLILVVLPVLFYLHKSRTDVFSAGALWLQHRKNWVRTYELVEVKLKARGYGWVYLQVEDRHEQRLWVPLKLLVKNRELWDLVYNGILHSAHTNRVRTNRGARKLLRLPPDRPFPPSIDSPDASEIRRRRAGVRRVAQLRAERRARGPR